MTLLRMYNQILSIRVAWLFRVVGRIWHFFVQNLMFQICLEGLVPTWLSELRILSLNLQLVCLINVQSVTTSGYITPIELCWVSNENRWQRVHF